MWHEVRSPPMKDADLGGNQSMTRPSLVTTELQNAVIKQSPRQHDQRTAWQHDNNITIVTKNLFPVSHIPILILR